MTSNIGPWPGETRGTKTYYYRSQREGKKVRRIYCGTGDAGKRAEADFERARAEREARKKEEKEESAFWRYTQILLKAAIALYKADSREQGWHQTKGEWRKMNSRTREKRKGAACTTPEKNTPNLSPASSPLPSSRPGWRPSNHPLGSSSGATACNLR